MGRSRSWKNHLIGPIVIPVPRSFMYLEQTQGFFSEDRASRDRETDAERGIDSEEQFEQCGTIDRFGRHYVYYSAGHFD